MSTTVLDALRNARLNFQIVGRNCEDYPTFVVAMSQLDNAIKVLENGKRPNEVIQENIFEEVKTD